MLALNYKALHANTSQQIIMSYIHVYAYLTLYKVFERKVDAVTLKIY